MTTRLIINKNKNISTLINEEADCCSNQEFEPGSLTTFIKPIIRGYDTHLNLWWIIYVISIQNHRKKKQSTQEELTTTFFNHQQKSTYIIIPGNNNTHIHVSNIKWEPVATWINLQLNQSYSMKADQGAEESSHNWSSIYFWNRLIIDVWTTLTGRWIISVTVSVHEL